MYLYNVEAANRSGKILNRTRTGAGISRKVMGKLIGVSESTIKNWECGQGSPSLSVFLAWFDAAGTNPFSYMLEFFWADPFKRLNEDCTDEQLRECLLFYFKNVAGPSETNKLNFLINGNYDGEWSGVLDLFCAHVRSTLVNRFRVAEIIRTSFELNAENRRIPKEEYFEEQNNLVSEAIEAARGAFLANKPGYTVHRSQEKSAPFSSDILHKVRIDSGVDRSFVAKALGKTERTVKSWETTSEPSFLDLCSWFRALDKSVWDYLRCELIHGERVGFTEEEEAHRSAILDYVANADGAVIRKLCYLIFEKHGSYWHSLLELMIEYAFTPLTTRVITARSVLIGYELESEKDRLSSHLGVVPDLDNVKACIERETKVAKERALATNA